MGYDTIANDDSGPPPPAAIIPDSSCSCTGNRQLSSTNPGNQSKAPSGFSDAQVRYKDGVVKMTSDELSSDGFGTAWGQTPNWSNAVGAGSGGDNGSGIMDTPAAVPDPGPGQRHHRRRHQRYERPLLRQPEHRL